MRLAWATDIHLDAAGAAGLAPFVRALTETDLDALVVTGDIGNADRLAGDLERLLRWFGRYVYFVLGNRCWPTSGFTPSIPTAPGSTGRNWARDG